MKTKKQRSTTLMIAALASGILVAPSGFAQGLLDDDLPDDLTDLSLESLMDIEVTTVSKKAEKLTSAASAIYVLTGEDIRRGGARTLPDALRQVPGLFVARNDAHSWIVVARGFASTIADKMEVLIDGRSIYTPFFSGVFWDVQDTFLEDIDRIEVIRGPGAALWGANAMNGVINIVTKSAYDSTGTVVTAGGGGDYEGYAAARQGWKIGENAAVRVYAQAKELDNLETAAATNNNDGWETQQAGFRADYTLPKGGVITVSGDAYEGKNGFGASGTPEEDVSGYNVISRWSTRLPNDSEISTRVYFDRTDRDQPGVFSEDRETVSSEVQYRFVMGAHDIIWGAAYKRSTDRVAAPPLADGSFRISFVPPNRELEYSSVFVQDQVALVPGRWTLTVSGRFEDNDFTGKEVQPNGRLAWTPSPDLTLWGAVSRALRIPNRLDQDLVVEADIDSGPGITPLATFRGSRDYEAEIVNAWEFGYRQSFSERFSVDLALYHNSYDNLRGVVGPVGGQTLANTDKATTLGAELTTRWQALDNLQLITSMTFQNLDFRAKSGGSDASQTAENDPHFFGFVKASWEPMRGWSVNGLLRHNGRVPEAGANDEGVDAYTQLDLRVAKRVSSGFELAIVGNNLLDGRHQEFRSDSATNPRENNEVERSIHGNITWRFNP